MNITNLKIHNFIGIEETSIDPKKLNIIAGKNGRGKTSIIEAIKAAFRGAGQDKIRVGATKAEIFLSTDELEIKRTITEKGTSVTVKRDDKILPKPQTFLDGIIGDFSFEPVKFFAMDATEQTEYLLKAIPVTATVEQLGKWSGGLVGGLEQYAKRHGLEAVGELTEVLYQERAAANATVKRMAAAAAELKARIPAGAKPVDMAELATLTEAISNARAEQQRLDSTGQRIETLNADIGEIEAQIVALTEKANAKRQEVERLQAELMNIQVVDVAPLQARLQELQKCQAAARDIGRLEDLRNEYRESHKRAEALDKAVKTLQKDAPAELMAAANMPVEGLAFADGGFTLNGVPIQNLSTSEKARLAVAVTRNLNAGYEVKAICLDGFESLDGDTQKAFLEQAGADDFQYFITKVADLEKVEVESRG